MTPSPAAPGLLLSRRPAPQRLLAVIALAVMLIAAAVPAVSAEEIYNETYTVFQPGDYTRTFDTQLAGDSLVESFVIYPPNAFDGVTIKSIIGQFDGAPSSSGSNSDSCVFKYNGEVIGTGECGYFYYTVSGAKWLQIWVTVDDGLELPSTSSKIRITIHPDNKPLSDVMPTLKAFKGSPSSGTPYAAFTSSLGNTVCYSASKQISTITYVVDWKTNLVLNKHGSFTDVVVTSYGPNSNIEVRKASDDTLIYSKIGIVNDSTGVYNDFFPIITRVRPQTLDTPFIRTHSLDDPVDPGDPSRVMVHIIAQDARNENLLLDAAVEVRDQYDAVVAAGTTSPEGWMVFEYDLPDTLTDEDFDRYYTVSVSLPGWTQKVTNFKFYPAFIPRSGDWIRVEMLPDTDGPADPEKTYIMFFVRDIHANPLERASIEIAGQYWHTNSAGHVAVEVPKNSTTAYTVRKTGHVSISGSAAVGAEGSYVVNIALGPALPDRTPGPGDDPGATPPPRDTRTNEEKGKAVIDLIADNAELIATLAILAAVMGLINLIMPGRRRR